MSRILARVKLPSSYPPEKIVVGELQVMRERLDDTLAEIAYLIAKAEPDSPWQRVEEATRLAQRALNAAVTAAPPLPASVTEEGEIEVGPLRIDTGMQRQWYGGNEFQLPPMLHLLLATMAAQPTRVFSKDELLREVWGARSTTKDLSRRRVVASVSHLRGLLVSAGAPRGTYLISLHDVGWSLLRPD